MAEQIYLFCKYGGATLMKSVNVSSTFGSVCDSLCVRWDDLSHDKIGLTYAVPDYGDCGIFDDESLTTMIQLALSESVRKIIVTVTNLSNERALVPVDSTVVANTSFESVDSTVEQIQYTEIYTASSRWVDLIKRVGQKFEGGAPHFRFCLLKFAFQYRFEFDYVKNDPKRVTAQCKKKGITGCDWRIHASLVGATNDFVVKSFHNEHNCTPGVLPRKKSRFNSNVVVELLQDEITSNPTIAPKSVIHYTKKNFGLDISYAVAWRTVDKGRSAILGDHSTSFGFLSSYFDELGRNNPGSVSHLEYTPVDMRFKRCFFAFGACLVSLNSCRPLLFMDGTFTKGRHKSNILSIVAKDGNSGLFPVAFGIVHEETDDNWEWFLRLFKECLIVDRSFVFVSDRCHGILEGVKKVFPDSPHGFCMRHLSKSLENRIKGGSSAYRKGVSKNFKYVAAIYNRDTFDERVEAMKADGRVAQFLSEFPYSRWANAYFEGCRYGEFTSNAAEAWNKQIMDLRDLPITAMVEAMRKLLMIQLNDRRIIGERVNSVLCPKMELLLYDTGDVGRTWIINACSATVFEVYAEKKRVVDIGEKICSCREWQVKGFPCIHAVAVLLLKTDDPYPYIDRFYYADKYKELYSLPIFPFEVTPVDSNEAESSVRPPLYHKTRGRPKTKRIPSVGEKPKRKFNCGRCHEPGHNKSTCTANIP